MIEVDKRIWHNLVMAIWVVVQFISQVAFSIYPAIGLFFCLFPDGRFVPRWSWLLIGLLVIAVLPSNAPPDSPLSIGNWPPVPLAALLLLTYGSGLFVQIYRYRPASHPEQRQQTKWFVFAFVIATVLPILYNTLTGLVPAFTQSDSLYQLAFGSVTVFFFLSIPLALGIAILRSACLHRFVESGVRRFFSQPLRSDAAA